jgi:hypothetical protein
MVKVVLTLLLLSTEDIKKFLTIVLDKGMFTAMDMEAFGDEGGNSITRAKVQALISVVMKDATDEEKDAYRKEVGKIYADNVSLKVENTKKMYTDPDVLTAMGIKEEDHEKTIKEITEHLAVADELVDSATNAVVNAIDQMEV